MKVTTSWDDGTAEDLYLSALLDKYNLKGTFYVCPKVRQNKKILTKKDIKTISNIHEIGAHTLQHPNLTQVSLRSAKQEIEKSKNWVESITGKPCTMFCYPYGAWNADIKDLVVQAGYKGSRTTEGLGDHKQDDPFLLSTTLQVRPFPWRKEYSKWWHPLDPLGPLRYSFWKLRSHHIPVSAMNNWLSLAKALFLHAEEHDECFHLWGHSSEIEKLQMWDDLEALFSFIDSRKNIEAIVNSDLIS